MNYSLETMQQMANLDIPHPEPPDSMEVALLKQILAQQAQILDIIAKQGLKMSYQSGQLYRVLSLIDSEKCPNTP